MGSLAEETPEDRRTENQSESHRTVIPVDGELRRDSDDILRVHAVHPKCDPRCLERLSPPGGEQSWKERKEKSERSGEPDPKHRNPPANPSRGSMEPVPKGLI